MVYLVTHTMKKNRKIQSNKNIGKPQVFIMTLYDCFAFRDDNFIKR